MNQTKARHTGRDENDGSGSSQDPDPPDSVPQPRPRLEGRTDGPFEVIVDRPQGGSGEANDETAAWLRDRLLEAAAQLDRPVAGVRVRIVHDAEMEQLHRRYRNQDGPTDVLTFLHSSCDEAIEADIAICLDEARRQARMRELAVRDELLLYAIHGLLHCAGFDDQDAAGARAMREEEDRILSSLGAGAIDARGERSL